MVKARNVTELMESVRNLNKDEKDVLWTDLRYELRCLKAEQIEERDIINGFINLLNAC